MAQISIIAAIAENNAIGLNGKLLYWIPADLKRFKALTTGHTIIMGRKTFDSLPKGALPNRRNVVLTRSKQTFEGAETFSSLSKALASCSPEEDIYIIGGASVYAEALPLANRLYMTEVHDTPKEADAFFPKFNRDEWEVVSLEKHEPDEKNDQFYDFIDYVRK
ncbi:MAG: dihydrofolate reductase [Bacteroidaceae bacterium]|nr:dihydrofolate reductase [Bacteroidaceae bacterium]